MGIKSKLYCCTTRQTFSIVIAFCLLCMLTLKFNSPREFLVSKTFTLSTCSFPHLDPFEPYVIRYAGMDKKPLKCQSDMPDLTFVRNNSLSIDQNKIKENFGNQAVLCEFQTIKRHPSNDWDIVVGNWTSIVNGYTKLDSDAEFLRAMCKVNGSKVVSKTYHSIIPRRSEYSKLHSTLLKKRDQLYSPKETLNVIMIGFDGVSRHQFLRGMNKTYNFLMTELASFDMTMHTQVGKDTFENYLALLGGTSWSELKKWWEFKQPGDALDLVWKEFYDAGYQTLFTEDQPTGGAFHYQKMGFLFKPTIYNSRPMALALERDNEMWKMGKDCVGSQAEFSFHMDYVRQFLKTFTNMPSFVFTFLSKVTHDDMTYLKSVDELVLQEYQKLQESGELNKTLLITFSDHGPRQGKIRQTIHGMVESRNPYTILTIPQWFLTKYPGVEKNLETNTARLTTHFDTFETLRESLYFGSSETPLRKNKHGVSLFQEIPITRTCSDIPIPPEFCLCGQKGYSASLDVKSKLASILAQHVMSEIATNVNTTLCANLTLKSIVQIDDVQLSEALQKDANNRKIYKVRLLTSPGDALFEGTVFTEEGASTEGQGKLVVAKVIERLNLYRGQAECVESANERLFCYCKSLLKI
ncbi:uncharacterized protein LOC106078729 [Biomphalaria glabrata]|uniref:Uncharacterized protein LOC106078729 n=1 Tax=Biomphalaria glabrata TaxID=6526 RepID=A0A9W2ZTR8_BIOGL|nr:uncharacterized protein LOC106078729 [Biomphalaria glabrata]